MSQEDLVSILVARSMARAHYVATMEYRFAVLAQAQYACAGVGLVKAIPDGWNGFYALPHGTPVFLVQGWEQRDDAAEIRARLVSGQLIQADLP